MPKIFAAIFPVAAAAALALAGWGLNAAVKHGERIAAVEQSQLFVREQLQEIRSDIKLLLRRGR